MGYRVLVTASRIADTAIRRLEEFGARLEFLDDVLPEDMLVAALETFALEPPDPANPLFAAPNLIVSPHIGAHTESAEEAMGLMAADNIIRVLSGGVPEVRNLVNPDYVRKRG